MSKKEENKVRTSRVMISAVQASNWLTKNTSNRPLNERIVKWLLVQIQKGKWKLTTDAIGFDTGGNLINGQHRLHAIVRANKDVECLVAYGLEPEAFNVIDTGKGRSAGDILGVHGFKTPSAVAAVIRFVIAYSKGMISEKIGKRDLQINHQDILDFAGKNKQQIEDTMEIVHMVYKDFKGLKPVQIGGLYWIFSKIHRDYAMIFFHYLATGIGLAKDDAIYLLRQKLIDDMASKKKFPERDKLAWCMLCWNHARKNNKITKLQWAGDSTTTFPKPI